MAQIKQTFLMVVLAAILLQETVAFVRVGRSEKRQHYRQAMKAFQHDVSDDDIRQASLSEKILDNSLDDDVIPATRSASRQASISVKILEQLKVVKHLIDLETRGDAEVYLFVAKSRKNKRSERRQKFRY